MAGGSGKGKGKGKNGGMGRGRGRGRGAAGGINECLVRMEHHDKEKVFATYWRNLVCRRFSYANSPQKKKAKAEAQEPGPNNSN